MQALNTAIDDAIRKTRNLRRKAGVSIYVPVLNTQVPMFVIANYIIMLQKCSNLLVYR